MRDTCHELLRLMSLRGGGLALTLADAIPGQQLLNLTVDGAVRAVNVVERRRHCYRLKCVVSFSFLSTREEKVSEESVGSVSGHFRNNKIH